MTAGAATAARLDTPHGVALNGTTLFIADTNNNEIRQVLTPLSGGNISTVAGTGVAGSTDGANALAAKVNLPWDVSVDGSNVIYIADTGNCRIRKFTVGGTMSSVVGSSTNVCSQDATLTPLTSVLLNSPHGLWVTSGGDLYIADTSNHVIRKLVSGGTAVTDFAGTRGTSGSTGDGGVATSAKLLNPQGVSIDGSNVYIADGNYRIRKVNSLTQGSGNISNVMGTGTTGDAGDNAAATGASATIKSPSDAIMVGGDLYVSLYVNIRKVIAPP